MKKLIPQILLVTTLLLSGYSLLQENVPVLYVIGDSTASDYAANAYPRTGWGTPLSLYFDSEKVKVDNRALSGRSSKSFYNEVGAWNKVIADMKSGDYLIIQFGHNDEKTSDPDRGTDPYTTYQGYLKKYIDEAKAKGGIPILATSINRNGWSGSTVTNSHGEYPAAVRDLGSKENVPVLDMLVKTKELFELLGKDYTTNHVFLHLSPGESPNYPDGVSDNTHLQEEGAVRISKLAVEEIEAQSGTFSSLDILKAAIKEIGYVSVEVNNESFGSVSGDGYNTQNDSVTLKALPKSGYALKEWSVDGNAVSAEKNYTFYLNSDSIEVQAEFATGYKVTTQRSPSNGGTVTPSATFVEGRTVILTATPQAGWSFVNWTIDDQEVSKDNPYSFTIGTDDLTVKANFTDQVLSTTFSDQKNLLIFDGKRLTLAGDHRIVEIKIWDMLGKVWFSEESPKNVSVQLDTWGPGVYIVKCIMEEGMISQKIYLQ